jgi:hypothetical protein
VREGYNLQGDTYFSMPDICQLYSISPGYVYKIASINKWRRRRIGTRVLYLLDDIQATLDRDE